MGNMSQSTSRRNAAEFAAGPFRPHGTVELWEDGAVIRVEAAGPFNPEAAQAMAAALRAAVAARPPRSRFALIVHMRLSMLVSLDTLDSFRRMLASNSADGIAPVAVAWVVEPGVEGADLIMPRVAAAYREAARPYRQFSDTAEADLWIAECLHQAALAS